MAFTKLSIIRWLWKKSKVEELNIKCEIYYEKNKNNTYKNVKLLKNVCLLCKTNQDTTYKIINYDKKNIIYYTYFKAYEILYWIQIKFMHLEIEIMINIIIHYLKIWIKI